MDDSNPPMVLPNGYVYGLRSLEEAAFRNSGMVQCPRSKQVYVLRPQLLVSSDLLYTYAALFWTDVPISGG